MSVKIVPIENKKLIQAVNKDKLSSMLSSIEYFDRVNKIAYMKDGREISFEDVKKNTGMFSPKEKKEFTSMIATLDSYYNEDSKKTKKHKKKVDKLEKKVNKVKKSKSGKKNKSKADKLVKKYEKLKNVIIKEDKQGFIPTDPLLYNTKAKDGMQRLATLTGKKLSSKSIEVLKSQGVRIKNIYVFFPIGPKLQQYTLIPIKSFLKFGDYKKVTVKLSSHTSNKAIGGTMEFQFKTLAEVLYFFRNTKHVVEESVNIAYSDDVNQIKPYNLNTEIESITVRLKNGKDKVIDAKSFINTHKSAFDSMERIEE